MAQTQNNLNNNFGLGAGITTHYSISYDDSLSAADGVNRGNGLIGVCFIIHERGRQDPGSWTSGAFAGAKG